MFRTITAKYPGRCRRCGGPIEVGSRIRYGGRGRTYHLKAECEGASDSGAVVSSRCEDYPCCGHGPPPQGDGGGCPVRYEDGTERFHCTRCGALMGPNASSALCDRCSRRAYDGDWAELESDPDSFFYNPHGIDPHGGFGGRG